MRLLFGNISFVSADIAQSVERRIGSAEVTGPIPVISLFKNAIHLIVDSVFLWKHYYNDKLPILNYSIILPIICNQSYPHLVWQFHIHHKNPSSWY